MKYGFVEIYFLGNDDVNFQGFKFQPVDNLENWQQVIKENLEQEFLENRYLTIYHSDNDGTPFSSVDEVMDTLEFKELTKEEFEMLDKLFPQHEYGHTPYFLNYDISLNKKLKP